MINAVSYVLLAGASMAAARASVVAELKSSPGDHFLLLLKHIK